MVLVLFLLNKGENTMLKLPERLGNMVIGYQDVFDQFDRLSNTDSPAYPPYNMTRIKDTSDYTIDMAVAGFNEDQIEISQNDRTLKISGHQKKEAINENAEILYRGIAARSFSREFVLAPHIKVKNAELKNGILTIRLYKEIPEELKPKMIPISST